MSPRTVYRVYENLLNHFGKQGWWLGSTPFEIVIGTIFTQHTTWANASRALQNLKKASLLEANILAHLTLGYITELIYPAGLQRQKANRIKRFSNYLVNHYQGYLGDFFNRPLQRIRKEILAKGGIGRETADNILLYAANKLIFPVDQYTRRVCTRLGLPDSRRRYEDLRIPLEGELPRNSEVYREFRALIVKLATEYCKKECPKMSLMPLKRM